MKLAQRRRNIQRPSVLTVAAALLASLPAQAVITTTGAIGGGSMLGPGDTQLPTVSVRVGDAAAGSLLMDAGSFMQLAKLSFGTGGTGNGVATLTGASTRLELLGNGTGSQTQRLIVGDFGTGQVTVSGGALLKSTQVAACLVQFHYCDSFVGGAAGDVATLTVTGSASNVDIANALFIGHPGLATQALNGYVYGVAGATVQANVNVLAGAVLRTDRAQVGTRQWDNASTGFEKSVNNVTVAGTGSLWRVTGGQGWDGVTGATITQAAGVSVALDRYSVSNIDIRDGGELRIEGLSGVFNFVNLSNGGRSDMSVRGANSALTFTGDAAVLHVGRSLGSALLSVTQGAQVNGAWYTAVGRDGSLGELLIDGVGSRLRADGTASAAASGSQQNSVLDIGTNGTGTATVSNGGRIELVAAGKGDFALQLSVGRGAASSGTLNIRGAGSVVQLTQPSVLAGGGPGEAFNPLVRIGREGSGQLNITAGGKLLLEGNAVSTLADSRGTSVYIGGSSDTVNGGKGIALVSGLGSEIRLSGSDGYIGVGHGPQSSGQLTVADQASVSSIGMNVGRSGGVGVLKVDNASLNFAGQQTGGSISGAFLSIGRSGGIGVADFSGGSVVTLNNLGSAGASLNLGGTSVGPLGEGSLTLSGASRVNVVAAPGLAAVTVGRDGSGFLRLKGASTVDVGDGNFYVGRLAGSDGTVIATEASVINAGWVGVGRNKTATGDSDGGTATMVLNGAMLNADTVVIGSNGFLGGTLGSIRANQIVNYGIFSPGSSPGRFNIDGNFTAGAGSRLILEVQADGLGGFLTDQVVFKSGATLDLSAMQVEFRFLGNTDPSAFLASGGFDVDTFLSAQDASGGLQALGDAAYSGVNFSARAEGYSISNFSYSAAAGANFTAAAVPEPGSWALMLAGGVALGFRRRRAR